MDKQGDDLRRRLLRRKKLAPLGRKPLRRPSCCVSFSSTISTAFLSLLAATSPFSLTEALTKLDLSYQPHVDAAAIVQMVGQHPIFKSVATAGPNSGTQADDPLVVVLDVSNSHLGDDGIAKLAQTLWSNHNDNNSTGTNTTSRRNIRLDVEAPMNRLTGKGVTEFLGILLYNNDNSSTTTTTKTTTLGKLNLGWNRLHDDEHHRPNRAFYSALQKLLASNQQCPEILCLERTGLGPAACRAMAKGLMARWERTGATSTTTPRPLSLHLTGNPIGDAGVAALAAAIRTICNSRRSHNETRSSLIFDTLDLSACGIGDAGIEALVLALENEVDAGNAAATAAAYADVDFPIRRLILSNNRISNQGALLLGRVFRSLGSRLQLNLDNNEAITDQGVVTLAEAVSKGTLADVSLCSCSIHADGAELWGKALRKFAQSNNGFADNSICVDLSGNPLGMLHGKSKSEGSKYSASRIKSTASATASAYMNHGLNFLKKGLGPSTVESDDDEEKKNGSPATSDSTDSSRKRCGFKALANAFIGNGRNADDALDRKTDISQMKTMHLGLRRTFCDTAGADALAAMLVAAKDEMGGRVSIEFELALNPVVEEEAIEALYGNDDVRLRDMAEHHTEAMEVLRRAQERAADAARVMAARRRAEMAFDVRRGDETQVEPDEEESLDVEEEWDSDADYENEEQVYE